MTEADLLIRGGYVALPGKMARVDLVVAGGKIAALAPGLELPPSAVHAVLEASGLLILPGAIDAAVRFLPATVETRITPTSIGAAFAAGGGTLYADLPGGRNLPVFDPEGFERKKAFLLAHSRTDFALWAGISGSTAHLKQMEALRDLGIVGFHAVLAPAERDGLPPVAARLLLKAMKMAARLGLPVHLHPEAGVPELPQSGSGGPRAAFLLCRPEKAETEAVRIALDLAGEAGCALFLSPLTLPASLALVEEARKKHPAPVVVTGAAAHHLLFSEEDGAAAEAAALKKEKEKAPPPGLLRGRPLPPLRPEAVRAAFLAAAVAGRIDLLGSGHAEAHGMQTAQNAFPALLTRSDLAPETGDGRARLADRFGTAAAALLGPGIAARKGSIAPGRDADLLFLDLDEAYRVDPAGLLYETHTPIGPSLYAGQIQGGRIVRVLQRGRTLFSNGRMAKIVKGREVCFIPRQES